MTQGRRELKGDDVTAAVLWLRARIRSHTDSSEPNIPVHYIRSLLAALEEAEGREKARVDKVEKIGCRAAELTFDWLCGEFEDLPNKLAEDMSVKITDSIIWALGEGSVIDYFADAEQQVLELTARAEASEQREAGLRAQVDGLRPEVLAFAHLMEAQLRANDHKPGWKEEFADELFPRIQEEAEELREAIAHHGRQVSWGEMALFLPQSIAEVGREAADVANFAMMIADVCGALLLAPIACGGCGATDPSERCIGCQHDFQVHPPVAPPSREA